MTEVDILVVGGGIAGAGVALEAARRGLAVMLVEARDFAWGSSSRSSKLVHGGLRYLREGAFGLTRESVRERGRLLQDAPGLVEAQRFLMGHYEGRSPSRRTMVTGLAIYDAMAGQRTRGFHTPDEVRALAPHMDDTHLLGASSYLDAKTDDARLVMRVLQEAQQHGARVVNRAAVKSLLRAGDADMPLSSLSADGGAAPKPGTVVGARIEGAGFTGAVRARCVVNATGFWADGLRRGLGTPMLRPLRGSHLVFPLWKLPVAQTVSLYHPRDGRPVFATPWEGVALVGTTDLDHHDDPDIEPSITADETAYLVEAVRQAFPRLDLRAADAICSFAGVRPVVDDRAGGGDPSKAPREHVVRDEHGLITVTGGKLTTFRVNALDALRHAAPYLAPSSVAGDAAVAATTSADAFDYRAADPIFAPQPEAPELLALPHGLRSRLAGRFGRHARVLLRESAPADLEPIAGTATPWAELHWALRHEQVRFLDDLLLRRTRLGLLLPEGAAALLPRLEPVAREALGWSAGEWRDQRERYARIIASCYCVPTP
ncbi:glycerol-3-phosphate dehydrogenase/oxidase [Scleromatobacter humisilvae]|uniref:Glycerol-3-phosphate dehydrogenase/oxidase n=1 Tax=Scleromatobacter humisilvae TaxID=2897159 RepID=A0A9X2BZE5_9BURK|nr:glycerol-3-phosphate dehydrogenase/oxidase [Scleromatobacter humisilvae]MCK9685276.1 glycerol-3-phosphate dehydrogenase/oxidase [Scleromatobacter humisilvae]